MKTVGRLSIVLGVLLLLTGAFLPKIRAYVSPVKAYDTILLLAVWFLGTLLILTGIVLASKK